MCGFIGRRVHATSDRVPSLERALPFLRRRGPDSSRLWRSADGTAELLHARLAIVDAGGAAHQPLTDPETGVTIVFNGEIYNYPELRAELAEYAFRTQSDTEAILAAYRRWGIASLARFRGTFALALVDPRSGRLYLARDAVGKKPLFLANWNGQVSFGSSVLALVAASGISPAMDDDSIRDYWLDGHVAPERSILRGCRPLLPGEIVEVDATGVCRSFRIDMPAAAPNGSITDRREQLRVLLQTAVDRRLRDNPEPMALLSGGIDSTVVTKFLRDRTSARALTLGALVPFLGDQKYAHYAARRIRIPSTVVRVPLGRIDDEVDFTFHLQDEPLGMMSFFMLSLLLRAACGHGRILFTGDGGDEVFLGYGRAADWLTPGGEGNGHAPFVSAGPPLPAWMSEWGRRTVTRGLVGHMFTKLDRASAEQGIEVRCPLLDWDVMAFARSLPPEVLLPGGVTKGLLKQQLSGWPRWFVERRKAGFTYHLRWAWALRGFVGVRERVSQEAVERFGRELPQALRDRPAAWPCRDILRHFPSVWKLLAWSAFERRLHDAEAGTAA